MEEGMGQSARFIATKRAAVNATLQAICEFKSIPSSLDEARGTENKETETRESLLHWIDVDTVVPAANKQYWDDPLHFTPKGYSQLGTWIGQFIVDKWYTDKKGTVPSSSVKST